MIKILDIWYRHKRKLYFILLLLILIDILTFAGLKIEETMLTDRQTTYLEGGSDSLTIEEYERLKTANLDKQYRLKEISFTAIWGIGVLFLISIVVFTVNYITRR